MGHRTQLGLHPIVQVQVTGSTPTPVQGGRSLDAFVLHVLDQGLDGRKARARGQQDHGFVAVFAQEKTPQGALDPQDVFLFQGAKHMIGEHPARHVPDVQLDLARQRVRRVGHRVAAARAVAQDELDVLAGAELKVLVGSELHRQHGHVGRGLEHGDDTGRQLEHRELAGAGHGAGLDGAIGLRPRAAGQDEAGGLVLGRQRLGLVLAVHDLAVDQLALARAAGAVLAAVGQADAAADRGAQQGLAGQRGIGAERHEGPVGGHQCRGFGVDGPAAACWARRKESKFFINRCLILYKYSLFKDYTYSEYYSKEEYTVYINERLNSIINKSERYNLIFDELANTDPLLG